MAASCQPVFVMASMLPPETVADTASLCTACEAVGGWGSMKGAQRIRGQWRLYPNTRAARDKLLLEGFTLGGTKIQPLDKNPFLLHPGGEEIPSTRLWIGNVPISCCDVVCIANHSRSISITEYSLCTPKVIIVQKSYSFQHNRSACRTAAHDMLRARLATCNYHLNPGLSIQSLS